MIRLLFVEELFGPELHRDAGPAANERHHADPSGPPTSPPS
jgi:hypothetical protein